MTSAKHIQTQARAPHVMLGQPATETAGQSRAERLRELVERVRPTIRDIDDYKDRLR